MRVYTLNGNMGSSSDSETLGVYKSIAQARVAAKKVRGNYYEMTIERYDVDALTLDTANNEESMIVEIL